MYQSLLISTLTFLSVNFAFANNNVKIAELFNKYDAQQKAFFASDITRKNVADKIIPLMKSANEIYEQIVTLEANEKLELSEDGTQLALEIELLEPIANFATSAMTIDDCGQYVSLASLNQGDTSDPKSKPEPVAIAAQKLLQKLCK